MSEFVKVALTAAIAVIIIGAYYLGLNIGEGRGIRVTGETMGYMLETLKARISRLVMWFDDKTKEDMLDVLLEPIDTPKYIKQMGNDYLYIYTQDEIKDWEEYFKEKNINYKAKGDFEWKNDNEN